MHFLLLLFVVGAGVGADVGVVWYLDFQLLHDIPLAKLLKTQGFNTINKNKIIVRNIIPFFFSHYFFGLV